MQSAYAQQSYKYLASFAGQSLSIINTYYVCRSLLVLGQKQEFDQVLQNMNLSNSNGQSITILSFLVWQRRIYFDEPFKEADLEFNFGDCEYIDQLLGDYEFVCGYNLLRANKFRSSLNRFLCAREKYLTSDLPLQAVVSAYNAWVCCHNLGDLSGAIKWSKIIVSSPIAGESTGNARHLQLRSMSFLSIHQSDYASALKPLRELIEYYSREDRNVDFYDSIMSILFSSFMADDQKMMEWAKMQFKISQDQITVPSAVGSFVDEILKLNITDHIQEKTTKALLKKWRILDINSVCILYLHQALCHILLRQGEFMSLMKVADEGLEFAVKSHQVNTISDLKYYRISALIGIGSYKTAERELTGYAFIARNHDLPGSQERAKGLFEAISRLSRKATSHSGSLTASKILIITPQSLSLEFGGVRRDLKSQPILFEAIRVIATKKEPIKIPDFFQALYGLEFNPLMHEARINSLLQRIRKLFSEPIICRRECGVTISDDVEVINESAVGHSESGVQRRQRIVEIVGLAKSQVTISDLVSQLGEKRRTLQLDLQLLTKTGSIKSAGIRKSRCYYV